MATQISVDKKGNIELPASATAPAKPPIPAMEGTTPINMNQTSHDVVFPWIVVFKPGISAKASKKVFLVTTMYLLISACMIGLLHILSSNHHRSKKPAAAPSNGVITIDPLPTTLPVTITLGPMYLILSKKVFGASCISCNLS